MERDQAEAHQPLLPRRKGLKGASLDSSGWIGNTPPRRRRARRGERGSPPLGGIVLAVCGLACIALWWRRDGLPIALLLTVAGLLAFALSHLLGLAIGASIGRPEP